MLLFRFSAPGTAFDPMIPTPLPELPQLYCGIYLREGGDNRAALEELADAIAAVLRPQLQVTDGGVTDGEVADGDVPSVPDVTPARASG